MGQYYHSIILKDDKKTVKTWALAHDLNNGLKLMEHSYLDNSLVNAVVNYLKKNNGGCLVWAGDYADAEPTKIKKEEAKELWKAKVASGDTETSFADFWAKSQDVYKRDEDGELVGKNLYEMTEKKPKMDYDTSDPGIRFLVNVTKKEYVDLWEAPCVDGYTIHPLPLLTAEGNGRGGGDYSGLNMDMVGTWARDYIVVHEHNWNFASGLDSQGYKHITPNFMESYNIKRQFHFTVEYIKNALESPDVDTKQFLKDIQDDFNALSGLMPKPKKSEVAKVVEPQKSPC